VVRIILVVISIVLLLLAGCVTPPAPVEQEEQEINEGTFGFHKYTYMEEDGKYAFIFTPSLPRDDVVLVSTMMEMINKIYGKHLIVDLEPKIITRQNTNLIQFEGKEYNYLFLVIKDSDGTVYSMVMQRENK